jgi:hypothetical protein
MAGSERLDRFLRVRLIDLIGDIDGEKIAGREEAIHRGETDVVCVAEIRVLPAECASGGIGCLPRLAGLRTNMLCSRLLLFQIGEPMDSAFSASRHASSCAFAWRPNRSPTPIVYF